MPKIRSIEEIASKWARVTPMRATDYEAGVKAPKEKWDQRAIAAEPAYEDGIRAAIGRKAYSAGIKKVGFNKWQRKTLEVGIGRWGPGVTVAEPDYLAEFKPFRDVIEKTELPMRYRAGDPRNYERVRVMGTALHEAKIK